MSISIDLKINSKHYLELISVLNNNGGLAHLVGGAVRDAYLNKESSDIDIATNLVPETVMQIMQENGIKVIPTGIKFGTVTAIIAGESFEITTLRKDMNCDGRHAEVVYSTSFEEDAMRRDFTINALSYDPIEKKLYDYCSGIEDLKNSRVRFIGRAEERIKEDYLRILRFFRFSCRYAKNVDEVGLAACINLMSGLENISRERIKSEIDGLLAHSNSSKYLSLMFEHNILQTIFQVDHFDDEIYSRAACLVQKLQILDIKNLLYSVMFLGNKDISKNDLLGLKFSRADSSLIVNLLGVKEVTQEQDKISFLKEKWIDTDNYKLYFIMMILIYKNDELILQLYDELSKMEKPIFPVKSLDLITLGYAGPELGSALKMLKLEWINSGFSLNKNELITKL